jgi:topoisomerase-4 subunit A
MKEVLRAFIDHKRDVLLRRSKHRMDKIDHRLEVLEGYIVAFLNLDRVIEIIRNEDEPKKIMMKEFSLSDVQVEAILNMRLRSLRKLEEIELRTELDSLQLERADLDDLLASEKMQWERIINELRETRKVFGKNSDSGNRRTELAEAPDFEEVPIEAMIEKEPITVVCSSMGWLRAMKGHVDLSQELKHKDGDEKRFVFHAETTDKLLMFGGNGRFYTMSCSELPGGRGMGEPIRLIVDLPNDANMVDLFIHQPDRKLLLASSAGDGFVVEENDIVAQTRTGKQALNVKGDITALICKPVVGDYVATVGQNRKVLIFPIDELPVMSRGKGVRMQKYKDGGLNDATTFHFIDGLSWLDPAGRRRIETELADWIGKRAGAGRMAPRGFPRENKFT